MFLVTARINFESYPEKITSLMTAGKKSPVELQRTYLKAKRDVFGSDKGGKGNSEKLEKMLQEWLGKDVTLDQMRPPDHPKYYTVFIT